MEFVSLSYLVKRILVFKLCSDSDPQEQECRQQCGLYHWIDFYTPTLDEAQED